MAVTPIKKRRMKRNKKEKRKKKVKKKNERGESSLVSLALGMLRIRGEEREGRKEKERGEWPFLVQLQGKKKGKEGEGRRTRQSR